MRGAPPVQLACGRDARWCWFQHVLTALAAATVCRWLAERLEWPVSWMVPVMLAGALLAGWLSARIGAANAVSQLAWDGRAWTLDGRVGSLNVMLDLGAWMLLRFDAGRANETRWLPLTLAQAGAAAHRCRAALHAPVVAAVNTDAHPRVAPNG